MTCSRLPTDSGIDQYCIICQLLFTLLLRERGLLKHLGNKVRQHLQLRSVAQGVTMSLMYAFKNKKNLYRVTSSLLPFTPAHPNLIVTPLKSDKVVFPGPPFRPPERVTIPVALGGISGTLRTIHQTKTEKTNRISLI